MAELHDSLFSQFEKLSESDEISSKGNRRRSQKERAIYTPGSGPLKKTENCDEEAPVQQTQNNKISKKNQKSEGQKEDKVPNNNSTRLQGGKKDDVSQSTHKDKKTNLDKSAPKITNNRNYSNSKDFGSKKSLNTFPGNKSEPPASKEPRSDTEDRTFDGKQKNRKPDSQIYSVPKPVRASNIHEQLNESHKDTQSDFGKNNRSFPKSSKYKHSNVRNETNKNFGRTYNEQDRKRTQSQKFSKENEDIPVKLNFKGSDDSHPNKPFGEGCDRNFSRVSSDENSRPSSSFSANKLPQTVNTYEPCNKPQNVNNPATNSTNTSSNYITQASSDFSHLGAQNQEIDVQKNSRPTSDPRSFQQHSSGANVNRNQLNSEAAAQRSEFWSHSTKFSDERRPLPSKATSYEGANPYRRNRNHRSGSFNDRGSGPEKYPVNYRVSEQEKGSGHNRGPGHDRSSGQDRGSGHDRGSGRNYGPSAGSNSDKNFERPEESHSNKGLANDSGPYPEKRFGSDRKIPPSNLSNLSGVQDRVQNSMKLPENVPEMGYAFNDRGRPMQGRRSPPVDDGQISGQGFHSVQGSNPDLRPLQTEGIFDPKEPRHGPIEKNISIMRHASSMQALSTERLVRNDHTIPPEANSFLEKGRYLETSNTYKPSPRPDHGGESFSFNKNTVPPLQNWNPVQEHNLSIDRNPSKDRGPSHTGWEFATVRDFPRGRGRNLDRRQPLNNVSSNAVRPLENKSAPDFHPAYDMPSSHDASSSVMSQSSSHERPMRDRMSNKPPMHQKAPKSTFTAPRFLRKAMEENRLKNLNQNMDFIGTNSEHKWDGSSATYSSRRDNYPANSASLPPPSTNLPPTHNQPSHYSQPRGSNSWGLPHNQQNSKSRGKIFHHMNGPDHKFTNDRPTSSEIPELSSSNVRTNIQSKAYHSNDSWKNYDFHNRTERNREYPDESSDNRRDRRLPSQSDTSSIDYQTNTVSRDSFSSDHSEKPIVNGKREDSSDEEEDNDEEDSIAKSVGDPFSMNWADAVENDDEFSEPVQRNEEPGPREAVRAPADRHSDRNRRRRKKSGSQERDLSRRRDSNASSFRQDGRFTQNEERMDWGRSSKPMGMDRNRRKDSTGSWNNERPFNRDRDKDRGGNRRNRNRSSKRGIDKQRDRDRERLDRDPENWRARNDSMSDSKPDFEPRSRDENHPKDSNREDGSVHREPVNTPKCPSIGGILVLPAETSMSRAAKNPSLSHPETSSSSGQQKTLFDPNNPGKPIYVPLAHMRPGRSERSLNVSFPDRGTPYAPQSGGADSASSASSSRPSWYDPHSESFKSAKDQSLLLDICRGDLELQWLCSSNLIQHWSRIAELRNFFELALEALLVHDLKFCEAENIECHIWKVAYHNLIELLRKLMLDNPEQKDSVRTYLMQLIEQGTEYFKRLLSRLEETYQIKFDAPINTAEKVTGLTSISLISAQKLFIFLGDLARYKEQVNETSNYGSARSWYLKAREMNPKNGKPYNQLALIAFCSKRKIDAVYYYMRSLMASNPIQSAKESLLSLFDNNRKKYESLEKKRMEDRLKKNKDKAKEKESFHDSNKKRREIWIRPDDGTRKKMTLTTKEDSEDEELSLLSHIEVNKRFGVSFLHIQGKLFNKVGMETFQDAAHQMLREFRALLQHSPMALNVTRLLQLLALNMFAIVNTQLKDKQLGDELEVRTVQQESALLVSLQMFNIILERTIQLLKDQFFVEGKGLQPHQNFVGSDLEILLPAIKVWCDWLMYHDKVWNPPPSCCDYLVGPVSADCWNRLASLANYCEKMEFENSELIVAEKQPEDFVPVLLPEDSLLSGFSPLISPFPSKGSVYTSKSGDLDTAQMHHRVDRILFFTTIYLRGLEPPVLKLQKNDSGHSEYISVVEAATSSGDQSDTELHTESMSEEEDCDAILIGEVDVESENYDDDNLEKNSPTKETRNLLRQKKLLEKAHRRKERYEQQVNAILEQCSYSVEMEVKPKYLVPDTNCFIDYLPYLRSISEVTTDTNETLYSLMVPLIVKNELQGLSRGIKKSAEVAESAKEALEFLCSQSTRAVKCVTTKGAIIHHASNFSEEEDGVEGLKNDDKILETCIILCKNKPAEESKEGQPRKIHRNVVLLTDDRHLRVKALCRDMPVRTVPDFVQWAGLG